MQLSMAYVRLRDPNTVLFYTHPLIQFHDHLVVVTFRRREGQRLDGVLRTLRNWCHLNYGRRGNSRTWNYGGPSNFGFRTEPEAMMFMTIWNGYSD